MACYLVNGGSGVERPGTPYSLCTRFGERMGKKMTKQGATKSFPITGSAILLEKYRVR